MRQLALAFIGVALLVASVAAKGPTTRIVITDIERGSVSEITSRSVLDKFQVWAGLGTYSGAPGQQTEGQDGFIVDWRSGIVDQRPGQLRRYELRFYVGPRTGVGPTTGPAEKLAYVVLYEHNPATGLGYVYLPGRADEHFGLNVGSILHGVEGHWLRASDAWQSVFRGLPAAR
jgi:hypothetical protein